jgi:RimJ/RimL family protein N-acetyltransferase
MTPAMQEVVEKWEYKKDHAIIVPYIGGMLSDTFPEDFLVRLYVKMKHDGTLRRTLPDVSQHALSGFVSYFHGKQMLICYDTTTEPASLVGFVWVYDVVGNPNVCRGSVGVCFIKEYWGNSILYKLGKLALRWMFTELNLSVILGTIAEWNRASVRFGRILGFKVCGVVPMFFLKEDSSTGMVMVALLREDFREHNG